MQSVHVHGFRSFSGCTSGIFTSSYTMQKISDNIIHTDKYNVHDYMHAAYYIALHVLLLLLLPFLLAHSTMIVIISNTDVTANTRHTAMPP